MKCISYFNVKKMLHGLYIHQVISIYGPYIMLYLHISPSIALREHLQEPPSKNDGFWLRYSLKRSPAAGWPKIFRELSLAGSPGGNLFGPFIIHAYMIYLYILCITIVIIRISSAGIIIKLYNYIYIWFVLFTILVGLFSTHVA